MPHVPGGDDIEHRQLLKPAGMFECEPITDARAAIMAGQAKAHKSERLHGFHHRVRHGALGVRRMIGEGSRRRRPTVAREIGDDQRKAWG